MTSVSAAFEVPEAAVCVSKKKNSPIVLQALLVSHRDGLTVGQEENIS